MVLTIQLLGILTKPDTLAQGEIRKWMGVINNEGKQKLNHGYYVRLSFSDA